MSRTIIPFLAILLFEAENASTETPVSSGVYWNSIPPREITYINCYSDICGIPDEQWRSLMHGREVMLYAEFQAEADKWFALHDSAGIEPAGLHTDLGANWLSSIAREIPERFMRLQTVDGTHWVEAWVLGTDEDTSAVIRSVLPDRLRVVSTQRVELPDTILTDKYQGRKAGYAEALYSPGSGQTILLDTRYVTSRSSQFRNEVSFLNAPGTRTVVCAIDSSGRFQGVIGQPNSSRMGGLMESGSAWLDDSLLHIHDSNLGRFSSFSLPDFEFQRAIRTPQGRATWDMITRGDRAILCSGLNQSFSRMRNRLQFCTITGESCITDTMVFPADPLHALFEGWDAEYDAIGEGIDMDPDEYRATGRMLETMGIWGDVRLFPGESTIWALDAWGNSLQQFDPEGARISEYPVANLTAHLHGHESLLLADHEDTHPLFRFSRVRWFTVVGSQLCLYMILSESETPHHPGKSCLLQIDLDRMTPVRELYFDGLQPYSLDGNRIRCLSTTEPLRLFTLEVGM